LKLRFKHVNQRINTIDAVLLSSSHSLLTFVFSLLQCMQDESCQLPISYFPTPQSCVITMTNTTTIRHCAICIQVVPHQHSSLYSQTAHCYPFRTIDYTNCYSLCNWPKLLRYSFSIRRLADASYIAIPVSIWVNEGRYGILLATLPLTRLDFANKEM
jgi:hypothetical protein